jgi:surface carbohydrate biosynthesis protein (TIGR04326 family)
LPGTLQAAGYRHNWIQHYIQGADVPNPAVAVEWTSRFNDHRDREGFHTFLDAFLSWNIVFRVVAAWLALVVLSIQLRTIKDAFRPAGSHLSLWPIMRGDWLDSMRGPAAVINLLWIELFDAAMRSLPHQSTGLYLCENQGWERAMIHAWRKHGHGRLIAVAHTTIRFWDLRYFTDPRTLRASKLRIPCADLFVLNGEAELDAYRDVPHPHDAVAEGESLRFGYLHKSARRARSNGAKRNVRVLVLGDHSSAETEKMLRTLANARHLLPSTMTFTLKPHPLHVPNAGDVNLRDLTIVNGSLENILDDFDVAYSSNCTSAAVDAHLAGLPLVVMLDDTQFNFSPLRGREGVCFVGTSEELAAGLARQTLLMTGNKESQTFFFLDPTLPRWKDLLGIDVKEQAAGEDPGNAGR